MSKYRIKVDKKAVIVKADRFDVQNGLLIFMSKTIDGEDKVIACFNINMWNSVQKISD
jgi:hypothetical protein